MEGISDKLINMIHHQAQINQVLMLPDCSVHLSQNPILRFGPAFSPECSAFAFLALAISASIIACVTTHRSGFGSVLPAKVSVTHSAFAD